MICTGAFEGQVGERFGLRVVAVDNAAACTAEVMAANTGGTSEIGRFGLDELRAGDATWVLEAETTYTIVMQVQSKVPGQNVSVGVEIPLGSAPNSDCSRLSSGLISTWRVDVF
ncbi:MAG: hypothetical protein ACREMY_21215 [bacterium]